MRPSFPRKRQRMPWHPKANVSKRARMAAIERRRLAQARADELAAIANRAR